MNLNEYKRQQSKFASIIEWMFFGKKISGNKKTSEKDNTQPLSLEEIQFIFGFGKKLQIDQWKWKKWQTNEKKNKLTGLGIIHSSLRAVFHFRMQRRKGQTKGKHNAQRCRAPRPTKFDPQHLDIKISHRILLSAFGWDARDLISWNVNCHVRRLAQHEKWYAPDVTAILKTFLSAGEQRYVRLHD